MKFTPIIIPSFPLDLRGLDEIKERMEFTDDSGINPNTFKDELDVNNFLASEGVADIQTKIGIRLREALESLGIIGYEIIDHDKELKRKELKKNGVEYIGSKNDFGDLNMQTIDDPYPDKITRFTIGGRFSDAFILFYKEVEQKRLDKIFASIMKTRDRIKPL